MLTETSAVAARLIGRTRYHLPEIVLAVALAWTLVALVALGGAFLEDAAIDGNRGTTAATVLDGSDYWRTLVRFVDDEGRLLRRTTGVASLGGATLDNEENYLIKKLFTAAGAIQIENQARI